MGTTAQKLQAVLNSKAAIKSAIEAKGVKDVGDVLSTYADKIKSIKTGVIEWTGHADAEGLRTIGWSEDDISYYQEHGVNWNEEDDTLHAVPEDNKALYGTINASNISNYKNILVYLPKFDMSQITDASNLFSGCFNLLALPMLDTSNVTTMEYMFNSCISLTCIPKLNTSKVTNMCSMFQNCNSLTYVPMIDTSQVTEMNNMFQYCKSIKAVPSLDTNNVTNFNSTFSGCSSLITIPAFNYLKATDIQQLFSECSSLIEVPFIDAPKVSSLVNLFKSCVSLKKIEGIKCSSFISNFYNLFWENKSLEYLGYLDIAGNKGFEYAYINQSKCLKHARIKGINSVNNNKLDLTGTTVLSKDSLLYIIQNAVPTSQLTISLSSYIYNKYINDSDITAALSNQPYITLASV